MITRRDFLKVTGVAAAAAALTACGGSSSTASSTASSAAASSEAASAVAKLDKVKVAVPNDTDVYKRQPLATIPGAVFSVWHNISGAVLANFYARTADKQ